MLLGAALLALGGCHEHLQRNLSPGSGSPDAAIDGSDPDAAAYAADAALGEPCVHDDARACASERQPLVCNGRAWQLDVPCRDDERCSVADETGGASCVPVHGFAGGKLSGDGATSCAIDDDGALYCWGPRLGARERFIAQDAATPTRLGSERWRELSVGEAHACAIRDDGTLWCWGSNCAGQLGVAEVPERSEPVQVGSAARWSQVAASAGRSCAIDADGALFCWGGALDAAADACAEAPASQWMPARVAGAWRAVAIGGSAIYALRRDGALFRITDAMQQRIGSASFRVIDAGPTSVCGIREDGTLACAEDGEAEETAIGERNDWGEALAVSAQVCATRGDGTLWCFGPNTLAARVAAPAQVGSAAGWVAVTARDGGGCGVRDARVLCWGSNARGELGIGELPLRFAPTQVGREQGWSRPTLGAQHSCALQGRTLRCFGSDEHGQLGVAGPESALAPVDVPGRWLDVEAAAQSTCAIDEARALTCWGARGGEEGLAATLDGMQVAELGSGVHACAVVDDGTVWCAGADGGAPAAVEPGALVARAVAASGRHACAVAVDGALRCWGENAAGELGLGTTSALEPPTEVAGGGRWLAVSVAANGCSCAITDAGAAGRLFCWGAGVLGCLGDGREQGVARPQAVGTASDWSRLSVGPKRACAVNREGALFCWGDNTDGGLGIGGADTTLHAPERIAPEQTWTDVAVSAAHACATAGDGTLWCWGSGPSGELGDGSAQRLVPTQIGL